MCLTPPLLGLFCRQQKLAGRTCRPSHGTEGLSSCPVLGSFALLLDLLGRRLGGELHVEVAVVRDVADPAHLLRGDQRQALHGRVSVDVHLR